MNHSKAPFRCSFEFFPPKTREGKNNLQMTAKQLEVTAPKYFSVTFGAGGKAREKTIETVMQLMQGSTVNIAPHISCISSSREELVNLLKQYKKLGVSRLVALRGDPPTDTKLANNSEFIHACDLVSFIREITAEHFHIEVACYPEFHPQTQHATNEITHFKRKVEAGANSALTQYFYNADAYFSFLDTCEKQQINIPIIPGIMPIINYKQLKQFSGLCGAEIPRWIQIPLESYKDDPESISKFGLEVVTKLCLKLLAGGAPGLHFYTLNRAIPTLNILDNLRNQIPKELSSSLTTSIATTAIANN